VHHHYPMLVFLPSISAILWPLDDQYDRHMVALKSQFPWAHIRMNFYHSRTYSLVCSSFHERWSQRWSDHQMVSKPNKVLWVQFKFIYRKSWAFLTTFFPFCNCIIVISTIFDKSKPFIPSWWLVITCIFIQIFSKKCCCVSLFLQFYTFLSVTKCY